MHYFFVTVLLYKYHSMTTVHIQSSLKHFFNKYISNCCSSRQPLEATKMANSVTFLLLVTLLAFAPYCLCSKKVGAYLYPQFYDHSCPRAQEIVKTVVAKAVQRETRMAASLLRLHFHDCFVKVCILPLQQQNISDLVVI